MRSGVDNLRPMLGDQFHHHHHHGHQQPTLLDQQSQHQQHSHHSHHNNHHHLNHPHHLDHFGPPPQFNVHQPSRLSSSSLDLSVHRSTDPCQPDRARMAPSYLHHAHHPFTALDSFDAAGNNASNNENQDQGDHGEHQQTAASPATVTANMDRLISNSYYQPLSSASATTVAAAATYLNLNQKRESVITFSHNGNNGDGGGHRSSAKLYSFRIDDDQEDDEDLAPPSKSAKQINGTKLVQPLSKPSGQSDTVLVHDIPLTIEQIICICQVLQKCDLPKLEKFIYNLPVDSDLCNKNELIIRAKALAAYHGGNFKHVYELLEANNFPMKYHQELQALWNNAHYKEHEIKRGHPPGAVEKYRIRKKYQFPRTIWDGEEYVYCFKEKNRRILKEFYQKCNLPTQEDKLKLSNETQLTVVQISNWFKNRRQRDRQPHHHGHHHHHHHHQHTDEQEHNPRNTQNSNSNDSDSGGHNQIPLHLGISIGQADEDHQNDKNLSASNLTDEDDDCCSNVSQPSSLLLTAGRSSNSRLQQQPTTPSNNLDLNRLIMDHHAQDGFNALLNGVGNIPATSVSTGSSSVGPGSAAPYYFLHHHHHHHLHHQQQQQQQ